MCAYIVLNNWSTYIKPIVSIIWVENGHWARPFHAEKIKQLLLIIISSTLLTFSWQFSILSMSL